MVRDELFDLVLWRGVSSITYDHCIVYEGSYQRVWFSYWIDRFLWEDYIVDPIQAL